jgi:hypothetical protein
MKFCFKGKKTGIKRMKKQRYKHKKVIIERDANINKKLLTNALTE